MAKHLRAIADQVWAHLEDSEEHRNGAVTITLSEEQAQELFQLYWNAGGKYRAALKNFGWSPDPTP